MRRLLPAVLLLLTGSALLRVSLLSNLYLRYVKESLRPALIATGAVLVLLAVIAAVRASREGDTHDDHGHSHSAAGPRLAWLLAVPAAMLLLFAPPALGSFTVARDGSGAIAKRTSFAPLPAADPIALSLTEFSSRAVWDGSGSLKGRTVRLTGFVTPGGGDSWQLSRIIVSCCAADARAVKVEVHGVPAPAADSWVTVTGVWRPGTKSPALDASSLTLIPKPDHPYRDTVQQ